MSFNPLSRIPSININSNVPELPSANKGPSAIPKDGVNFGDLLTKGMENVNKDLNAAQKISEEHLVHGKHDLHEVMIALEKADMSFRYMSQIRNKVIDIYTDVMRMQV